MSLAQLSKLNVFKHIFFSIIIQQRNDVEIKLLAENVVNFQLNIGTGITAQYLPQFKVLNATV